jgi:hypothetical protein
MVGEKLKEVGQVFGKHHSNCFFVSLEHAPICVLSHSWVMFLSLSYNNTMIPHTPSAHTNIALVIVALCFG